MGLSKGTTLRRRCQVGNGDGSGILVFRSCMFFCIKANPSCDLLVIFAVLYRFRSSMPARLKEDIF